MNIVRFSEDQEIPKSVGVTEIEDVSQSSIYCSKNSRGEIYILKRVLVEQKPEDLSLWSFVQFSGRLLDFESHAITVQDQELIKSRPRHFGMSRCIQSFYEEFPVVITKLEEITYQVDNQVLEFSTLSEFLLYASKNC